MEKDMNLPVAALINDLDALMAEIDENPQISSWVVRLVLKSIKDKARKMVTETTPRLTSVNQPPDLDAFVNSSTVAASKVVTLR